MKICDETISDFETSNGNRLSMNIYQVNQRELEHCYNNELDLDVIIIKKEKEKEKIKEKNELPEIQNFGEWFPILKEELKLKKFLKIFKKIL